MQNHSGVFKYLDASTCHITLNDVELLSVCSKFLDDNRCGQMCIYDYPEGYFIPISDIDGCDKKTIIFGDLSESFRKIYFKALDAGCYMLRLIATD